MPIVVLADSSLDEQRLSVVRPNNEPASVRVANVDDSPWDYVIRAVTDLPAAAGGYHTLVSGSYALAAAIDVGANVIRVPAGVTVFWRGMGWDKVLTSANYAFQVEGTALIEGQRIESAADGVAVNGAAADLTLQACQISAAGSCVEVTLGHHLLVMGGSWENGAYGLLVAGALDYAQLLGIEGSSIATNFVRRTAGAQEWCVMSDCVAEAGVASVSWAAASVPAHGLVLVGNFLNAPAPWALFTQASALVNAKANTQPGALTSETPIVP